MAQDTGNGGQEAVHRSIAQMAAEAAGKSGNTYLLIAGIAALVSTIAIASTAGIALTQEIHTASFVNGLAKNVSNALGAQERIDKKLEEISKCVRV